MESLFQLKVSQKIIVSLLPTVRMSRGWPEIYPSKIFTDFGNKLMMRHLIMKNTFNICQFASLPVAYGQRLINVAVSRHIHIQAGWHPDESLAFYLWLFLIKFLLACNWYLTLRFFFPYVHLCNPVYFQICITTDTFSKVQLRDCFWLCIVCHQYVILPLQEKYLERKRWQP